MTDSSDDEWGLDWVPYRERPDWADVTPLPQDDGPNPIVAIAYSPKFRDVFDYFRAVLARQEKSLRALELTKDAVYLNPANYTVWQYRRDILRELNMNLHTELEFLEQIIYNNAKNYQVWHHRRCIVEMLNNATLELNLTQTALSVDAKNYHAWQHRQWAITTFNLFDDELTFVDRMIAKDIRNNSAWNQRFFVVQHQGLSSDVLRRELQYAMNRIRVVKNNESAWNYLSGILRHGADNGLDQFPEVLEFCEELYASGNRAPYLLAFLIDLYQEQCLEEERSARERERLSRKVFALCDDMSKKHDPVRRKYWQYFAKELKTKLNPKCA